MVGIAMTVKEFLQENGYTNIKMIDDTRYAGIFKFMYTCAIIVGRVEDSKYGYDDRWCYHDHEAAKKALDAWDGIDEPEGWHRHPKSGRRRPDGDKSKEYVNL